MDMDGTEVVVAEDGRSWVGTGEVVVFPKNGGEPQKFLLPSDAND